MREIQFREALREAMSEEMRRDDKIFLMGEEVAQYNGAYKVTEGLWARFGDKRVLDTPITEAAFIGLGVVRRVSRLLHTPLMSLTNAISAIAVVGSIVVTGAEYPRGIRLLWAVALFASMTNIVSGFLITDRMLKLFKRQ